MAEPDAVTREKAEPEGLSVCGRCNNYIERGNRAFIGDTPYCHPMNTAAPTCYMRETWEATDA